MCLIFNCLFLEVLARTIIKLRLQIINSYNWYVTSLNLLILKSECKSECA